MSEDKQGGKADLDLKSLLDKVFEDDGIEEGEWALLQREYGQALNNGDCPCGSGEKFTACCKQMWNAAQRSVRRSKEDVVEAKKQNNRDAARVRSDQPEWLFKVGVDPKTGQAVYTCLKERLDPWHVANLCTLITNLCTQQGVVDMINSGINALLDQMRAAPSGRAPSGPGIIEH